MSIEDEIENAATRWIVFEDPGSRQIAGKLIEAARDTGSQKFNMFCQRAMHVLRDPAGLTAFERFVGAGTQDWNNDQRLVLAGRIRMRARLIELKRPIDALQTEVTDLLDPEAGTFLVCDRSLARHIVSKPRLLATTYNLPHFVRIVGAAAPVDGSAGNEAVERIRQGVRKQGGPSDLPGMERWIFEHMIEVVAALISRD